MSLTDLTKLRNLIPIVEEYFTIYLRSFINLTNIMDLLDNVSPLKPISK